MKRHLVKVSHFFKMSSLMHIYKRMLVVFESTQEKMKDVTNIVTVLFKTDNSQNVC